MLKFIPVCRTDPMGDPMRCVGGFVCLMVNIVACFGFSEFLKLTFTFVKLPRFSHLLRSLNSLADILDL